MTEENRQLREHQQRLEVIQQLQQKLQKLSLAHPKLLQTMEMARSELNVGKKTIEMLNKQIKQMQAQLEVPSITESSKDLLRSTLGVVLAELKGTRTDLKLSVEEYDKARQHVRVVEDEIKKIYAQLKQVEQAEKSSSPSPSPSPSSSSSSVLLKASSSSSALDVSSASSSTNSLSNMDENLVMDEAKGSPSNEYRFGYDSESGENPYPSDSEDSSYSKSLLI